MLCGMMLAAVVIVGQMLGDTSIGGLIAERGWAVAKSHD